MKNTIFDHYLVKDNKNNLNRSFNPKNTILVEISILSQNNTLIINETLFINNFDIRTDYESELEDLCIRYCIESRYYTNYSINVFIKYFKQNDLSKNLLQIIPDDLNKFELFKIKIKSILSELIDTFMIHHFSYEKMNSKNVIKKYNNNKGYLLLFALYIKYVGNIAKSYELYLKDPNKYNGFRNYTYDNLNKDYFYITRRDFNKFLQFIIKKRMVLSKYIPELITEYSKYISEGHKFGNSTMMLRMKPTIVDALINANYNDDKIKHTHLNGNTMIAEVKYLINEIKIYKVQNNLI